MATAVIKEQDGTLTVEVPKSIVDELHLESGSPLDIFVEQERVVMQPRKSRYTLEQLLKEQAEIQDQLPVDQEWLDAPRVGRELI